MRMSRPTDSGSHTTGQEEVNIMAVKKRAKKAATKKPAKKTVKRVVKKTVAGKSAKTAKPVKKAAVAPKVLPATRKRYALLKELLLKKRNEVVAGIEAKMGRKLIAESGQKVDSAMDSADMSSQDSEQGIDYSLLELKYEQYKDIADAFRKLENATFGLCEECGEEISIKRLEVNPLARFCIPCKTRKEDIERIQKEETRFKE